MEVKNIRFFAPSVMERATKLIICFIILLLVNYTNVLADTYTNEQIIDSAMNQLGYYDYYENINTSNTYEVQQYDNLNFYRSSSNYKGLKEIINQFDWVVFQANQNFQQDIGGNSSAIAVIFCGYGENPFNSAFNYIRSTRIQRFWFTNASFNQGLVVANTDYASSKISLSISREYLEVWAYKGEILYTSNYEDPQPPTPYFEFSANKIGTTTIENVDGNINTYYRDSFRTYSNSYTTFKYIGDLYIPKEYILEDIYMPVLNINKYNLNMNNSWNYKGYDFFKEDENEKYIRYSINIDSYIMTSPYYYNINLKSVNENYDDININFVIINKSTTGGTIVENNSGDIISGDDIKDETTLGDINNTIGSINDSINEPYNKNESELNNLTSGDVLENLGYEITEDPNADLWDTIINGLKEVLTGNEEVVFEFELRKTKHQISSKQITMPQNELKTFIALAVNFYFLIQMFQFIKKTIDQINEGNLKVMHDVDADCYFF